MLSGLANSSSYGYDFYLKRKKCIYAEIKKIYYSLLEIRLSENCGNNKWKHLTALRYNAIIKVEVIQKK